MQGGQKMKHMQIEIFNAITEVHFQFQKQFPDRNSMLFPAIKSVLKCDEETAEEKASTHCNLFSSYSPLRAKGIYNSDYVEFFSAVLKSGYVNDKGYISDKPKMYKAIGIETTLEIFREYEDIINPAFRLNPEMFYQVKIKSDSGGDHFMACYIKNGILYLSDTSYRGIGVKATDYINQDNFQKITEIV
jgi:hypothetical protein